VRDDERALVQGAHAQRRHDRRSGNHVSRTGSHHRRRFDRAANTSIGGASVLGERTRIGPNARLYNARLGDDVIVTESVVLDSAIGARSRVGPFAHLRGGNELGSDVHIGDFVEVKNSRLANGVKANHHAYLAMRRSARTRTSARVRSRVTTTA